MFLGCPSVSVCVRACVLLAPYLINEWAECHGVVKGRDELIRF